MLKLVVWGSEEEARKNLSERLKNSMQDRKERQATWLDTERIAFNTQGNISLDSVSISPDNSVIGSDGVDQSSSSVGTNYLFKNLRFIHAQLSANPPTVIPRPTSNDPADRRRADAADRLVRYAMRQYGIPEIVDLSTLSCLSKGAGFIKTLWDENAGDVLEYNEATNEMLMEGDFSISIVSTWDMFLDPDATTWEDVRYAFERIYMPYEEACFRYPEKKEVLKKVRIQDGNYGSSYINLGDGSSRDQVHYDVVEIFQYWEKGLPVNGFLGRFCVCTRDGELITPMQKNPEAYKSPGAKISKAVLPFHMLTDIDVPDSIWGKSFLEFGVNLQDNLNKLDSVLLENVQAHGVARIILPEGSEIADDSITNSPYDIVKITGTQPPHFMAPMPLPAGMTQLRDTLKMGIDDISGVNEAMFGQQSREQSGFSMQYATNQGNMIRRRLFNKYVLFIESIYKRFLEIVQKHWTTPRTIHVLGKEKAFEALDIKGADIAGGYDLVVEYGASLSLDPTTRREEIMTLMPVFEKAGVTTREILSMLKLNELSGMYDRLQLAEDRQREIFEEMNATGMYIAPEDMQDNPNMLAYAYYYLMTTEFKYLKDEEKELIRRHVREREQMEASAQAGAPPQAPGPAPMGPEGPLPVVPGGVPVSAEEAPPVANA